MEIPVLLVDDNPIDVDLTKREFRRARLANPVLVARDGQEALDYLQRWDLGEPEPAVILLDINLPRLSGFEVFHCLQDHPVYRLLPVVFLLSSEEDRIFLEMALGEPHSCIVKPITKEKFIKATLPYGLSWSFDQGS